MNVMSSRKFLLRLFYKRVKIRPRKRWLSISERGQRRKNYRQKEATVAEAQYAKTESPTTSELHCYVVKESLIAHGNPLFGKLFPFFGKSLPGLSIVQSTSGQTQGNQNHFASSKKTETKEQKGNNEVAKEITVPELLSFDQQEVESWAAKLQKYQAYYAPLWKRREQREDAALYLQGLLQGIENKSAEGIVLALLGPDINAVRSMQHFISQSNWDDRQILQFHWQEVERVLAQSNGVLTVDGSDHPKGGSCSAAVYRQSPKGTRSAVLR